MRKWLALSIALLVVAFGLASFGVVRIVHDTSVPKQPFAHGESVRVEVDAHERKMIWVRGSRPDRADCSIRDRRGDRAVALHPDGKTNTNGDDGHWEALYWFDSGSGDLQVRCTTTPVADLVVWEALDPRWFLDTMIWLFGLPGVVALVGVGFGLLALRAHLRAKRSARDAHRPSGEVT